MREIHIKHGVKSERDLSERDPLKRNINKRDL